MTWDGLRPDQVSPEITPNLSQLAASGVWFERSHAVFPSVTRANSPAIATGCRPGATGIPGNTFLLPTDGKLARYSTGDATNLERLAEADGRPIVLVDTLADRVHRAGKSTVVVGSGSPGSAWLQHPRAVDCGDPVIADGIPALAAFMNAVQQRFGTLPPRDLFPATRLTAYFTRVITEFVLPEIAPTLLIFWHTDPDHTSHHRGYSAPETIQSLKDADANLGAILQAYDRLGLRDSTDFIITSDHGGSTITRRVKLGAALPGASLADNGGAIFAYAPSTGLIETIRQLDYVGPVFTDDGRDNTFPFSLVGIDGPRAPDIVFSLAWSDAAPAGVPGTVTDPGTRLKVNHGSISPFELHNTLVAAGPSFRSGWRDPVPVGNIDICPTLTHVLGLDAGTPVAGRVLTEALRDFGGPTPEWHTSEESRTFKARGRERRQRIWFEHTGAAAYLTGGDVVSD